MAKAAYPTIGIAAFVMFGIVYFIGCYSSNSNLVIIIKGVIGATLHVAKLQHDNNL